jgi:hypothetical protein
VRVKLKLHPDGHCEAVASIEVEVARPRPRTLALHYFLTGAVAKLRIPPHSAPARAHGLWQHTCVEAVQRTGADADYQELNFAPSSKWAAYRFDGYRSGMTPLEIEPPQIVTQANSTCYELRASLEPDLTADAPWQLGLSAVIEETSGSKSYWALAHPPGAPDFHHPTCFALELPPAPAG